MFVGHAEVKSTSTHDGVDMASKRSRVDYRVSPLHYQRPRARQDEKGSSIGCSRQPDRKPGRLHGGYGAPVGQVIGDEERKRLGEDEESGFMPIKATKK